MSNPTGVAGKGEAPRPRSAETPGEQTAPSSTEVESKNSAATKVLTDAIKPLATEYEQQKQKLEDRAKDLKDNAETIAQQEAILAEIRASHAELETKLAAEQSELEAEGKKQSEVAKEELGKIGEMVGKDNPALEQAIKEVPAGLTEGDAKKMIDSGIKKLAPDIAKNIVDPTKKPEERSQDDIRTAESYERVLLHSSGTPEEKVAKLKEFEKIRDQQQAQRDEAVKGAIEGLTKKLPEKDRESATASLNIGFKALDQSGTSEEQKTNIKNALGAEVGSKVMTSGGRTFEVTGHKDGILYLQGEDLETGGIVEQKVPYKNCRIESLADGTPLADRYEKTLGTGLDIKPEVVKPAAPASAPAPETEAEPDAPGVEPGEAEPAPETEAEPDAPGVEPGEAEPAPAPTATVSKEPPIKTPMTPEQRRKIATDAVLGGFKNPNVKVDSELQKRIDDYSKRTQGGATPEEFEKWVLDNEFDRGYNPTDTSKNRSNRIEQERKVRENSSSSVDASTVPAGGEKPQMSSELKRNIAKDVMSYGQGSIQLPPENAKRMQEYVNSSPNNETKEDFISRIQKAESDILQKKIQEHKQQAAAPTLVDPVNAPAPTKEEAPTPKEAAAAAGGDPPIKTRYESKQIDRKMTFGEFAAQLGLDTVRLNDINATDYKENTVLEKGSNLVVPIVVPTTPDASVPAATPKPTASATPTASAPAPAPIHEGDAGANTRGNGETARKFVPVGANGSAQSAPNPYAWGAGVAQNPDTPRGSVTEEATGSNQSASEQSSSSSIDTSLGFDKVKGKKHGDHTELEDTLSDGSMVSVYNKDGLRAINIGKNLQFADNNAYNATINITFKNDGSINDVVNTENWDTITGNERTKILEELKKIGLTLPS